MEDIYETGNEVVKKKKITKIYQLIKVSGDVFLDQEAEGPGK